MPKILPVKNTTPYDDAEIATLVQWVNRHIGPRKVGIRYAEVLKARQGASHCWSFKAKLPAHTVMRLSPDASAYPATVRASGGSGAVNCADHRETLLACAAVAMSYAEDYTEAKQQHCAPYYNHKKALKNAQEVVDYLRANSAELDALIEKARQEAAAKAEQESEKQAAAGSWQAKRERLIERRDRWESKQKRAETAIKKLTRQIRALDRYHEKKQKPRYGP